MRAIWCERAVIDGRVVNSVRVTVNASGRIDDVVPGAAAAPGDVLLGTVVPGMGNAHSHAFHRALRGLSHDSGGDFWRWRKRMYRAAAALDPDRYRALATGVFGEMLAAGWTAVGEFHYVHHQPDGRPYLPAHAMEDALCDAAETVGIRIVLLDTLYLSGGLQGGGPHAGGLQGGGLQGDAEVPLAPEQRRFGDGDAAAWLDRWHALDAHLAARGPLVSLGAALHSVRAVPQSELATAVAGLPASIPLHIHLSEQPQENADCLARYGVTPTRLLADLGSLSSRLAAVHATHLTDDDIALLGAAGVTVVMCPTTEADLGDGIGPARRLADAGARIALGSDQNAVVDPFLEMRALEAGERLGSGRRGRFSPNELWEAAGSAGYAALGLAGGFRPGSFADLVEIDTRSVRTVGADVAQLPMVATAADVRRVVVGGRVVASSGLLRDGLADPAELLAEGLGSLRGVETLEVNDTRMPGDDV